MLTRGQVKWFDPKKGYGFILGPVGQDVFVHYSQIQGEGFKSLKDGEAVAYELIEADKGYQARTVSRAAAAPGKDHAPSHAPTPGSAPDSGPGPGGHTDALHPLDEAGESLGNIAVPRSGNRHVPASQRMDQAPARPHEDHARRLA